MPKCTHPGCNADILFAINTATSKRLPLVPWTPDHDKTPRYRLAGVRNNGDQVCEKAADGFWMSHYANCPGAKSFTKRRK